MNDGNLPNRPARPIYLDYQSTTPTDPRVLEVMLPLFTEQFGNPHSDEHELGRRAAAAVEQARGEVASLIGAEARELIFTSGATESNNLAIKGAARFRRAHEGRSHLVTLATEHKCVLESAKALGREGFEVEILPVGQDGLVDLDRLAASLREDTALVSVMAVNNEIGIVQPLAEIGALTRPRGIWLHSDAAQAAGKIPLDVDALQVDLLSISGHKLYGPKGIGALYVRRRPRVRLEPLFDGGGQERGLRSGTLPAPLCVGLGEACRLAGLEMAEEAERLTVLRARFLAELTARVPGVALNGDAERRIPGNLNLSFEGVETQELIDHLVGVAASSGSACSSAAIEPSYVVQALGLPDWRTRGALRIGLGRFSTGGEIDRAVGILAETVASLRARRGAGGGETAAE
ncbi:MAG: aminotransferase class V-fold PLP-dependent enzyme [Tistlia sp.]|uniref:cysteine desulfurase family protein n=1 Tax=Tistlia sp. TaxID=3057121 RepID=UPI0034A57A0C